MVGRPRLGVFRRRSVSQRSESVAPAESVAQSSASRNSGNHAENQAVGPEPVAPRRFDPMEAALERLERLFERIQVPNPAPPPAAPPLAGEVPEVFGAGFRREAAAVAEESPSYLKVLEHMQRLGTAYFLGGAKPLEADEWRDRLERNFDSIRCPADYKVDIAGHYLSEDAYRWWKGVLARKVATGAEVTWNVFCAEFNLKYFPQESRDRLEAEFLYLSQGNKSVREYEIEFNRLKRFAGGGFEDEQMQVRRFLRGLRLELKNRCMIRDYTSVSELVEKAAVIEDGLKDEAKMLMPEVRPKKPQPAVPSEGAKFGKSQKRKWDTVLEPSISGLSCYRCGSPEHRVADCPKEDTRVCYNCQEKGHVSSRCPKLQQAAAPATKRTATTPRIYTTVVEQGEGSKKSG